MLTYILDGLVLGSVYAIAATGIVVTYSATWVLNFAFGGIAYSAAVLYYSLHTTRGWGVLDAGLMSIVVAGSVVGLLLWGLLFRHARQMSVVVKIVATVGVLVALPTLTVMVFNPPAVYSAPGLAHQPPHVYHLGSVSLNADEVIVLVGAAAVALVMSFVMRGTSFGLTMRAVVDRPAVAEIHGTRTAAVEAAAWVIGCVLAAFVGVLLAPIVGLGSSNFTGLVITAMAAAVVARLRSVPVAFGVAIAMGVVQSVLVEVSPSGGLLATAVQPAVPLIVLILFLLVGPAIEEGTSTTTQRIGVIGDRPPPAVARTFPARAARLGLVAAVAVVVPLLLSPFWMAAVAAGMAFAVVFLSFTLLGIGGITSLGQAAYAGLGGFFTAYLITSHGFPTLLAVLCGGVVAAVLGLIVGMVTMRLGVLSLAIMTLAVAGFFDEFAVKILAPSAGGALYNRPVFAGLNFESDRAFAYLMMVVFALGAFGINRMLRGPMGLALRAVRSDEGLSRAVGLSPRTIRLILFASSSFVAGVGGALLGMYQLHLGDADVATLSGIVWLAVLVTIGSRSATAALVAGLAFTLAPAAVTLWLPSSVSQVPAVMFGLGAIALAGAPDGMLRMQGDLLRAGRVRLGRRRAAARAGDTDPAALTPVRATWPSGDGR